MTQDMRYVVGYTKDFKVVCIEKMRTDNCFKVYIDNELMDDFNHESNALSFAKTLVEPIILNHKSMARNQV
jgi:hypothetical protein